MIVTKASAVCIVCMCVDNSAIMTHASVAREEREQLGISDSLVRLSVGLEDVEDLIADLDQALMTAVSSVTLTILCLNGLALTHFTELCVPVTQNRSSNRL